jgi:hypothetical protein
MTTVTSLDDLHDHLLQCDTVDSGSEAMRFALRTIEDVKRETMNTSAGTYTISKQEKVSTPKKEHGAGSRSGQAAVSIPKSEGHSISNMIFATIRFAFVEFPLVIVFALGVSTMMIAHVYENYWGPQIDLMTYTDENRTVDLTYYHRQCTPDDISAETVEDLYIHSDFTTEQKVEHILTHGMSVYQNVLSDDTASELRSWVLERNQALNTKDEIDVISNENRWSFYIGANDNPLVSKALHEVATNEVFRPAVEKIVGRNPAIIEMTAITSAYGAADQFWHHDIISNGSPAKFARSFIPSYSLFMTLQVSAFL